MARRFAPLLLVVAVALAACGSDKHAATPGADGTAAAADAPPATTAAGCRQVRAPRPKPAQHLSKPARQLSPSKAWVVHLQTNCGAVEIRLDVKRAPKTASSFASLVQRGLYDGLTFHRIVPGFVVQGGDPLGTGSGGPGYTVVERPPTDLRYTRRVVAMAKTQVERPGTSGSQFFIVTAEDAGLPPEYALVGQVTGSFAAVARMEATPHNPDETPVAPVVIEKASLRTG
jgi:peptidyl-prolyl cis-trans isomerase B (cyclophilin B)